MKRAGLIAIAIPIAAVLLWVGYLGTQQPKLWFNHKQGIAKLLLLKGRYRSWGFTYADGETMVNEKWSTVSYVLSNGVPVSFHAGYRWPTFSHLDMLWFTNNAPGLSTNYP